MNQPEKCRTTAENYYRNGKWLCSEAVVTVINDMLSRPLPPECVKMASGFPVGIGSSGCACGALTGGVMALGLAFGRTIPGDENTTILKLSAELHDWFKTTFGSACCRVLIKKVEFGGKEHIEQCTRITGLVAEYVANTIEKNGIKLS